MTATAPQKPHRRSIRLKGYDYTQAGAYFVTIVTQGRECLFGEAMHGAIDLSQAGKIAQEEWFKTGEIRPNVKLNEDEFIVMPNHVYGIIWIMDKTDDVLVGAQRRCVPTTNVLPGSLGAIARAFKSSTTGRINALNDTLGAPLWQRNYYEYILRDHNEWDAITTIR